MKAKCIQIFFYVLCVTTFSHAQVSHVLRGRIFEYKPNGERLKLDGVNITTKDEASATDAVTMSDGSFRLSFVNRGKGQRTALLVYKAGWKVVNNDVLENIVLAEDSQMKPILMCQCTEKELLRLKTKFYVGDAVENEYQNQLKQLNDKISELNQQSNEYGKMLAQKDWLLNQRNELLNNADRLAEYVSEFDEKESSENLKKMVELIQFGKIESALNVVSDEFLAKEKTEILRNRQKEKAYANLCFLKAQCEILLFKTDLVSKYFEEAFDTDPKNFTYRNEYTLYLKNFGEEEKALSNIDETLEMAKKTPNTEGVAFAQYYQQAILTNQNMLDLAQKACQKALLYFDSLNNKNVKQLIFHARTLSDMGQIMRRKSKFRDALDWYKKALIAYNLVSESERNDLYRLHKSYTFNGLCMTFGELKKYDEMVEFSDSAILLRHILFAKDTFQFARTLGEAYNSRGLSFELLNKMPLAAIAYDSSAYFYEIIVDKNPQYAELELARLAANKSILLIKLDSLDDAEKKRVISEKLYIKYLRTKPHLVDVLTEFYMLSVAELNKNEHFTEGVKLTHDKIDFFQKWIPQDSMTQKAILKLSLNLAEAYRQNDSIAQAMSLFERYLPSLVESHDSAEIFKNRFFLARVYQEAFTQKQQVVFKQKALILIDFLENDLAQRDTNDIYAKNSKQSIRLLKSFFMDLSDNQIRQWKNIVELNKQVIILNKTEQQIPQREQLIRKLQRLHESDRSNSYFLTYHLLSNYRKQAIDQTKSHNIAEALRNTQSAFDLDVNDDKTKAKLGLLLVIQYKFDEGMDILASVKNSSRIDEELLSLEKIGLTHVDFAKIKNHFREFKFPVAK